MTQEDLLQWLKPYLSGLHSHIDWQDVFSDTEANGLLDCLDSLQLLDLIEEIEIAFGISIPLDEFPVEDFETLNRFCVRVVQYGGTT